MCVANFTTICYPASTVSRKILLVAGVVLILLGVAGFFLRSKLFPGKAGLLIETTPQSTVFLDGEQVGTTPYSVVRNSGEVTLRLVPQADGTILAPWGAKVRLIENVKTIVRREFGETESASSGEILSFEKIAGQSAQLAIISTPDSAQITVDGEVRGFTPVKISSISVGEHKIVLSHPGYKEREISSRAEAGYKLTIDAILAQIEEHEGGEATPSGGLQKTQIEVLDTPTGFLRVRMEPATTATEAAQVKPGKKFALLEESTDKKWFKIEYEKGKQGWVSAQYAKKTDLP